MSPTEVGLLILAAILVCTLAAGLTQQVVSRHRSRRVRIAELRDEIRHLSYLAQNLPAPFQSAEIRSALATNLTLQLNKLKQLAPRACREEERLAQALHLTESLDESPLPAAALTQLPDQPSARRVRALLRDLAQLLQKHQDNHELHEDLAQRCQRHIKSGYHRVSCDLSIMEAQALEARGRAQLAVHQYRNCLGKLRAIRSMQNTTAQIQNLQLHLDNLEKQLNATQARKD